MPGSGASQSSESESYGYLPYISPGAASMIGQYQASAADNAAALAKQAMADAMASITKNFTSATEALRPATQSGVQAQNELNRYLGLNAYNPGSAPTAPTAYTPTATDIKNYLRQNTNWQFAGKDNNIYAAYEGAGSKYDGWSKTQLQNGQPTGKMLVGYMGAADPQYANAANPGLATTQQGVIDRLYSNQSVVDAVKAQLAQEYADNNKDLIAANNEQYQKDLEEYNLYKQWYDQSPGAYTTQEVQDRITNQPGYQAQFNEGINAVQKAASTRGLLGSGNMLKDLTSFASQLEGQYYSDTLNRLAQQAAQGTSAAGQISQNYANQGSALGQLKAQLGDTLANSQLAKGQALASAFQLGNTTYNKVLTGKSSSQSSSGGGLSGIGSILGGVAGMFSSKTYKTKGKNAKLDLKKLDALPVEKWKYKKNTKIDPTGEEHIGPYAEDFQKVFGVGDGKSIPIVSSIGILYGLVKELNKKVEGK